MRAWAWFFERGELDPRPADDLATSIWRALLTMDVAASGGVAFHVTPALNCKPTSCSMCATRICDSEVIQRSTYADGICTTCRFKLSVARARIIRPQ
jgi:hypothetical protein